MASFLPREFIVATGSVELKKDDDERTVWSIQCSKREEIVRCRDCMYYQHNSFHRCDLYSISHEVEPDGFCAWASRKEVDA